MSETQNTDARSTRSAVCYIDEKPHLELAAEEFIYPVTTPDDRYKLYVAMKTYRPFAVKKFYDLVLPRRRQRTATEREIQARDKVPIREFILDHFISFSGAQNEDGSALTEAQQRLWLEENDIFTDRIFSSGIDAVGPETASEDTTDGKAILVFGQRDHRIRWDMRLWSAEKKMEERIRLTSVLDRLTQPDRHRYEKAVAVIENSRRNETFMSANWDVIEQLYNQKTTALEGAVIDGAPCTAENKADWIGRLPLIPKIYIMAQASMDIQVKN